MKNKKIWPSILIITLLNIIGIYFVRTDEKAKDVFSVLYLPLFFVVFIGSLIISAIKGDEDQTWAEIAFMSRFYVIVFMPIYLASLFK